MTPVDAGADLETHATYECPPVALLSVRGLELHFVTPAGRVRAVNGISYTVEPGELVAIVGESGSGKTVQAQAVLGLVAQPPGEIVGGAVEFDGVELLGLPEDRMRALRGRRISMVFQEPMTSLNPVLSIGRQLTEAMRLHLRLTRTVAEERAVSLLGMVGIADPERRLRQYPHHLSGGMRQRVMIAIAIACEPLLIVADEPTTALDVTIQAQILALMQDLTRRLGVALVIITHDLGVVARYADRVNVMYAGRIVEHGAARDVYRRPAHPYTIGLLNSVPRLDRPRGVRIEPIPGSPPDPARPRPGCAFAPRCPYVVDRCTREEPPPVTFDDRHVSTCWQTAVLRPEAG